MRKLILLTCAFYLTMMSCDHSGNTTGNNNASENQETISIETYVYNDSLFIHLDDSVGLSLEDDYAHFYMEMDVPQTENMALRQHILQWMLDAKSEDYVALTKAKRDEFFTLEGGGGVPEAEFEEHVKLVEQKANYVTYVRFGELNSAITHTNPWRFGVTFSKADGNMLGYNLFDHAEQMAPLVEKALMNNKEYSDWWEGQENIPDFKMPSAEPWIENDSVTFFWGSYEIGPFAMGCIECKIPLKAAKPYFNEKGKALFK